MKIKWSILPAPKQQKWEFSNAENYSKIEWKLINISRGRLATFARCDWMLMKQKHPLIEIYAIIKW